MLQIFGVTSKHKWDRKEDLEGQGGARRCKCNGWDVKGLIVFGISQASSFIFSTHLPSTATKVFFVLPFLTRLNRD